GRGEAVTAFERAADRRTGEPSLGQLDQPPRRNLAKHSRQDAVVRSDKLVITRLRRQTPPPGADAWIHDREKDGAGWKGVERAGELERAVEDVVCRHIVGDVD